MRDGSRQKVEKPAQQKVKHEGPILVDKVRETTEVLGHDERTFWTQRFEAYR